jgi:flagellar basal body rod protein FlgB
MDKAKINDVLKDVLAHTPEVSLRAGKPYAHGKTEPGGLIAVTALKDRIRVSFITSAKGNDVNSEDFLNWVNKSGILGITIYDEPVFTIKEGSINSSKREVCAEIFYSARSSDEIIADTLRAYNALMEKLSGTFTPKKSTSTPVTSGNTVDLHMTLNFNDEDTGSQHEEDYAVRVDDPTTVQKLLNLLEDPSETNLENAVTAMFANPDYDGSEALGSLYSDLNPKLHSVRKELGWEETIVEFMDIEIDSNTVDLDEETTERLTDDLRLQLVNADNSSYLLL